MAVRKHNAKRNLTLTATALVAALFAGSAGAMADVERHKDLGNGVAEGRTTAFGVIDGPVGSLRAAGKVDKHDTGELRARLIDGKVGHRFDAE